MNEDPQDLATPSPAKVNARWGQERRLAFIDFRLRWEGRINRSDLTDFFGISVPQASLDISRYMEFAPQNLQYDRSARVYLATPEFRPLHAGTSMSSWPNLREPLSRKPASLDGTLRQPGCRVRGER